MADMNESDVAETLPLPSEGDSPEVREHEVQEASSTSESLQDPYLSTQSPNHFPQAMPVDFTDVNFNTIQRDTEAAGRLDELRKKMINLAPWPLAVPCRRLMVLSLCSLRSLVASL